MLKYFSCYNTKPKLKRNNTPYPRQSVIDLDEGTIEIKSKYDNVIYEYIAYTGILHAYKNK